MEKCEALKLIEKNRAILKSVLIFMFLCVPSFMIHIQQPALTILLFFWGVIALGVYLRLSRLKQKIVHIKR